MYALCVSGAVNTQGFVCKFFYALYINFHSFIHSWRGGGGGEGDYIPIATLSPPELRWAAMRAILMFH